MQRQFPYGPPWRLTLFFIAVAVALLILAFMGCISFGVGGALATVPLGLALATTLRRLLFPRFLELGEDTLLVYTGFLQARSRRIAYADIQGAWEVVRGETKTLTLKTKEGTIEIKSILLPEMCAYVSVREFVNSHITPKEKPARPPPPAERGKYCFRCSYEGDGEVYDSNGEALWRVKTLHFSTPPHYPYGFFRLPDFVFYDKADAELVRVTRKRKWPLAHFVMVGNGSSICTIRQRSVLLNKYTLDFVDGQRWVFRMPLFTVFFGGSSKTGETIRVRNWSHNVWYVLIDAKADNPRLVAALAFLHRERLRCN